MKLAPIILFVYNRPWHTLQTLEALSKNELADQSVLYIYADGAKENASKEELRKIEEVRLVICKKQWCKEVNIVESDINNGLANSIINGVTEVINQSGKAIVLEDDLITSIGFLKYMNEALEFYNDSKKVMHISAYWFPVENTRILPETFFYNTATCWGWATWARAWEKLEPAPAALKEKIKKHKGGIKKFNIEGDVEFISQLDKNISGEIETWAIKWYGTLFINDGFSLHPHISLVNNIGNDNSGVNCGNTEMYTWAHLAEHISIKLIPLKESKEARKLIRKFYKSHQVGRTNINSYSVIKWLIPSFIKRKIKSLLSTNPVSDNKEKNEFPELSKIPRYQPVKVNFLNKKLQIIDNDAFLSMYHELFEREIYKFKTLDTQPYIIDGRANIGLATIYFKKLYPNAEIIAFEADKKAFEALEYNMHEFNFYDVKLIRKRLWHEEASLRFFTEGADGQRIASKNDEKSNKISTVSLRPFLQRKVNFLKLCIDKTEANLIVDCKDQLHNVDYIFIEFHSFMDNEQQLHRILQTLEESNFRYYLFSNNNNSPNPFIDKEITLKMDDLINIAASRIKK